MTATNKKTSEEQDAGPLDGTEEVRLAIAGSNYKTTTQAIANLAAAPPTYSPPPVRPYTASHTLALTDAPAASLSQGIATFTSATGVSCTVPAHTDVAWVVGTVIQLQQLGAGQLTVVAASGVTVHTPASLTTRAQYSTLLLTYIAVDVWTLSGDMT